MWINWLSDSSVGSGGSLINLANITRIRSYSNTGQGTYQIQVHGPAPIKYIEFSTAALKDAAFETLKDWLGDRGYYLIVETGDVLNPDGVVDEISVDASSTNLLHVGGEQIYMSSASAAQAEFANIKSWLGKRNVLAL